MLNIVLFAVTPEGRKPDKELVGKMNRARSLRNDYMHEGKLPADQKELVDLFENTKRFVQYLRELDEEMSNKANQG